MGLLENILTSFLDKGVIVHKAKLSDSVYHIRIQNDDLKNTNYSSGDFLRVFVGENKPDLSFSEKIRSYSVWKFDQLKGEIDLALTTHGNGPGARFATDSKIGDQFYYRWHQGKFTPDHSAKTHVFIGDLSTLSQYYEFNRTLKDKVRYSIVYNQRTVDFFNDLDGSTPFEFYQLPLNPIEEIFKMLEVLKPLLGDQTTIYVAGDSRVCVSVTQYLRNNWKWNSKHIKAKAYWNPVKRGLE